MNTPKYDTANGFWKTWRAARNLLELDEAGLLTSPLSSDAKKMLEKYAAQLFSEFDAYYLTGKGKA